MKEMGGHAHHHHRDHHHTNSSMSAALTSTSNLGMLEPEEHQQNVNLLLCGPGGHDDDGGLGGVNETTCANASVSFGTNGTSETDINPFYYFEFETLTFLWILLLFIVIGNSAVLASLMLTKTQRKSRMNFFIMHLAMADLSVGLMNVLLDVIWKMTLGQWFLSNLACKLVKYIQVVVIFASNYVLVALSIDRYDAITHPLKFSGSWRRARLLIASAWGLSFTFAIPTLFLFFEKELINEKNGAILRQCWIDLPSPAAWQVYLTMVSFAVFIIPALIITICYTIMVHTIWTQSRILTPQGNRTVSKGIFRRTCKNSNKTDPLFEDDSRRASSRGLIPKAKIKSVKMTFVIVFVFLCCSSPYVVFSMLQVYDFIPKTQTMTALGTFFTSLSPLNSAANPIIYCLFSTHVGRNLRKIKFVNWIANRMCPKGNSSPNTTNKRKSPGTHHHNNHNHDISQKTRTDFTSLTDSYRRAGQSSMNRFSKTKPGMDVQVSTGVGGNGTGGSLLIKEVKFQTNIVNGGVGAALNNSGPRPPLLATKSS